MHGNQDRPSLPSAPFVVRRGGPCLAELHLHDAVDEALHVLTGRLDLQLGTG